MDAWTDEFASDLAALKKERRVDVSETGQENRTVGARLPAIIGKGSLPPQGAPEPMCSWLGTELVKFTFPKTEVDLTAAGVSSDRGLDGSASIFSMLVALPSRRIAPTRWRRRRRTSPGCKRRPSQH